MGNQSKITTLSFIVSACFVLSSLSDRSFAEVEVVKETAPQEIDPKKVMKLNKRPYVKVAQEAILQSQYEKEGAEVDALMDGIVDLQNKRNEKRTEISQARTSLSVAASTEDVSGLEIQLSKLEEEYEGLGSEMQTQLVAMQDALQKQQRAFNTLSNALSAAHEAKQNAVRNVK